MGIFGCCVLIDCWLWGLLDMSVWRETWYNMDNEDISFRCILYEQIRTNILGLTPSHFNYRPCPSLKLKLVCIDDESDVCGPSTCSLFWPFYLRPLPMSIQNNHSSWKDCHLRQCQPAWNKHLSAVFFPAVSLVPTHEVYQDPCAGPYYLSRPYRATQRWGLGSEVSQP